MKILSFTTLWPNHIQPFHSLFVRERIKVLARQCDIQVIAPVPWFPPIRFLGERYYHFSQVLPYEKQGELDIFHPRFLTIPRILKSLDGFLMYASVSRFVRQMQKKFSFDLIDAHWAYPDGYAAARLSRKLGIPYTVTVRGSDITVFAQEKSRGALIRQTLNHAARVICVSDALKHHLSDMGIPEEKAVVVENGVDFQKFHPVPRDQAREKLDLPLDAHILLSVGYLHELKGFHLLIEALCTLRSELGKSICLFIVGEDDQASYKDHMMRQISENHLQKNVFFAGTKKPDELKYWYSAADIFCLASSREGCPNVVLESLACGTPVLATAVGGIPGILSKPELGMLVERNPESIRHGIARTLKQNQNTEDIVAHARTRYSWENTATRIYNIFRDIL